MRFSIAVVSFTALSAAAPLKRRQNGPVLADTTFNDITISGGVAGDGEAEALAVFSALDLNNPENIDPADIDFLGAVNDVANDAEVEAFNTAIEAATGAEADALEAGKTKNKILKLMATKIELEAKQAQGEDVAAKLEEELTKLNNNIATDVENAGNPSTAVSFDATISGGGNVGAAANNNAAVGNDATEDVDATEDATEVVDETEDATDDTQDATDDAEDEDTDDASDDADQEADETADDEDTDDASDNQDEEEEEDDN